VKHSSEGDGHVENPRSPHSVAPHVAKASNADHPTNHRRADQVHQASSIGLKLTRRASEIDDLDKLFFFLTNDIRTLIRFDRCFLLVHFGGDSYCAAVNNQVELEQKSTFTSEFNELAVLFKDHSKVVLLSKQAAQGEEQADEDMSEDLSVALRGYIDFSGCQYLLCVPLLYQHVPVAHIVFEFINSELPGEAEIEAILNAAPALATSLAQRWLESAKPAAVSAILTEESGTRRGWAWWMTKRSIQIGAAALIVCVVLFLIPVTFKVGGEAEIVPVLTHKAFATIDGLIEDVLVSSGQTVHKDQPLATMDETDIEYEIRKAARDIDILAKEIDVLKGTAAVDPSKGVKLKISELKRAGLTEASQYLKRKREFLTIKAPARGVLVTKDVETLKGKSLKKGEVFCEIAIPKDIHVEIKISEERIGFVDVKNKPKATVYLNTDPWRGYTVEIDEISPQAEALPRLGNVFLVRGPFPEFDEVKIGMKGVAKIDAKRTNLWEVLTQRMLTRWNQFMLYF
jgi:hypothetical protein